MKKLFYFFPTQLLLYHIKRNYLFIIFWAILFLIFGIAMYQGNKGEKPNGPALDEEAARKMQNKLLGID